MSPFGELLTAMCTPMRPDGAIDLDRAAELANFLADNGSDGIVVSGTTGESPTLTDEEKLDLFREVVRAVGGRVKVVAGTGSYDTEASTRLTRKAESTRVDGIMCVTPYYNKPPQDGLYMHFRKIAESTSLPIMLYNVPSRTGGNIKPDTVARLASGAPNIVALKEAAGNMAQVTELKRVLPDNFTILSGDDPFTLPMLALGAHGVVSVASHVVGLEIKQMIQAFKEGDVKRATRLHNRLMPVFDILFITTNPIPVKWSMSLLGLDLGPFRLPLTEPSPAEKGQIKNVFAQLGLIEV